MKTVQFTACYKLGHSQLRMRSHIHPQMIVLIQEMVDEIPEKLDGCNSVIEIPGGMKIYALDATDHLVDRWEKALANL